MPSWRAETVRLMVKPSQAQNSVGTSRWNVQLSQTGHEEGATALVVCRSIESFAGFDFGELYTWRKEPAEVPAARRDVEDVHARL